MYFPTLLDLHEKLRPSCQLDIFGLEYTRTPDAKHPVQLREAVYAYRYLVETLKIDPSDIILGGDSAGSRLALLLLQHIQSPHPDISIKLPSNSRPSKCIFVSPWLVMQQTARAYISNASLDVIPARCVRRWAAQWAGTHRDEWTDPLQFQTNWREIVPPSLVMSGEREIFIDDINEFCLQLKEVSSFLDASANNRVDALWLKNIDPENHTIGGGEIILYMGYLICPTHFKVMKC
jgi:acetyl esterase/lipase